MDDVRVLGVHWDHVKDEIFFKIEEDKSIEDTKRDYLSKSARIFDPLGFLSPVTLLLKRATQDAWNGSDGLEEKIPPEVQKIFNRFKKEAGLLNNLRVPRWVGFEDMSALEFHGFADASKRGYGVGRFSVRKIRSQHTTGIHWPPVQMLWQSFRVEMITYALLHTKKGRKKRVKSKRLHTLVNAHETASVLHAKLRASLNV